MLCYVSCKGPKLHKHYLYMPYFSRAILGFSGNFSGTNDIFLGQILQNSGTLSGTKKSLFINILNLKGKFKIFFRLHF